MSIDESKGIFIKFAKDSFEKYKNDNSVQEYSRSLLACINILTGKASDDNLFTIQAFYPEYGAAILTSDVIFDPINSKLFIVGLDSWEFTIDANGRDSSVCDGKSPAFLACGEVPKNKHTIFLSTVGNELKKAELKRKHDRHASNTDGGFQRTPGFLRSTCIKVLCAPQAENVVFGDVVPPIITPQCSGFTDVGMHTGCNRRDTIFPLILSVLNVTLKNGINPPLTIPDYCYTRFVIEYYLNLATAIKERTQNEISKHDVNLSMHYLKVVSRYIKTQSPWNNFWPDFLTMVEGECTTIRKHLEDVTSRQARIDSERFKVILPNFSDIERASSPTLQYKNDYVVKASDNCWEDVLRNSSVNIDWLPLTKVQSFNDCKKLIEDKMFDRNDPYTFSSVFVSIETFLFRLAKNDLSASVQSANRLSIDDIDIMLDVCDKYIAKLHDFRKSCSTGIGGFLSTELLSHEVLISWLKFCLLFKTCCDQYSILAEFSVPLHYADLEHLVLKDKWAWELLNLICEFLRRHSKKGNNGVVFSGRKDEINDMLNLADAFVTKYAIEYGTRWTREVNEANMRSQSRWKKIECKKLECRKLRDEIEGLHHTITVATCQRDSHERYVKGYNGKRFINHEWDRLNESLTSLKAKVYSKESDLEQARQAPEYLKQPLPPDANNGKRALFFIYMPPLLRHTWRASFQAQEMIFSDGECMQPPVGTRDFHSFYNDYISQHRNKNDVICTPLSLFMVNPPDRYGTHNVENIIDMNDGVWYPSGFNPSFVWNSKRNPFISLRTNAVKQFCEPVTSNQQKWTYIQYGLQTPKARGNWALSQLYQKPLLMEREQFLTLENLRASPLHQLFHLLNSIKEMSLPFHDSFFQTTHTVVRLVLFHIGEIKEVSASKNLQKLWKWGIENDAFFMNEFRNVLVDAIDRVKEASKNENEFLIYLEIISFFAQFDNTYVELMDQCSDIALGWAERMQSEIQNARDKSQNDATLQTQERRHTFLLYALLSYEMLVELPDCSSQDKRIRKIIELRLLIGSCQPEKLSEKASNILGRIFFFLSRIISIFPIYPAASWNQMLTSAIRKVLPGYDDHEMQWNPVKAAYIWWTKNATGNYIWINIMNGIVLVNGSPLSLLPLSIRQNKLFRRVFGEIDFEVTVDKDGVHRTRVPIRDRHYSFYMNGDKLLIYEEYIDEVPQKLLLLDTTACTYWTEHLPIGMTELYSHWLDPDNFVLFRPVGFEDRSIYYTLNPYGLYKVPRQYQKKPATFINKVISTFDKFLVLDQKMKAGLSFFSKFDREEYIHPYLTNEKALKIVLVRYRISFELKQGSKVYDCSDFGEFKLRSIQQFDNMIYKFYNYLIMEKKSGEQTVIFPQGEVKVTNNIVSIERPTLGAIDEVSIMALSYNTFTAHRKFCHLQGKDILSGLQLAAVQAATSTSLPEKGTRMTGFEMAIRQIRKCWVNSPLKDDEQIILKSLMALNDLPPALVILAHQLLTNSSQLSFLYKDISRPQFNADSFTKALNEYNLPLQPHSSTRNFRLMLKFDEMWSAGVCRSESNFYSLICQSTAFEETSTKYQRMKDVIASYELELISLICAEKREYKMEFPLRNVPAFDNKIIGNHIVQKLRQSHQHYSNLPQLKPHDKSKQNVLQEILIIMHKLIESDGSELLNQILHQIHKTHSSSSLELKTILVIEKAANEIPCLTMCDLLEATLQPSSLSHFNPLLSKWNIEELIVMIIDWVQFSVLSDRIQRVQKYLQSYEIDNALLELNVQRCYDPYEHPAWLAFEFDQGLQIRPDQATILHHVLSNNGSVTQLNMGLGKTRVIVPCLILEFSRRRKIPRVFLLPSLLDEGYDYLRLTLTSSVFTKKLFRFPFSRDVKLSSVQTMILWDSLKYCERTEGAVILAPEHTLSLYLKRFELEAAGQDCIEMKMPELDSFHFADIFDEIDEIMRPQKEVRYAKGTPKPLEYGPRRWCAVFAVFFKLRHNQNIVSFFDKVEIADFESSNASIDEFNGLRLRPGKRLEKERKSMIEEIVESLFCSERISEFPESTIDWMKKPLKSGLQARIVDFITDCSQPSDIIHESEFFSPEYFQDLLVLRGLLAHDLLIHCLKLRHFVNYGVVSNHKTLMAIPFEAANLPKLRSEFSQPDIAIILTVVSYYNIGLTRDQVIETVTELLAVGKSLQRRIYKEMFALCKLTNNENNGVLSSVDIIEKLDLKNDVQVDLMYTLYRKNMIFINFWLGSVLFPTATMIFPENITASSWNLTDSKLSSFQCGFSGTDDACLLLPHPLLYDPPDDPSLLATNGKMLEHLITKATYCSFNGKSSECIGSSSFQDHTNNISGSSLLAELVDMANEKDASAFIDVGALLCNHPMETVARFFLSRLKDKFKGVVYFSVKHCSWRLIDKKPCETNLKSSSISERDAFVIYDQSRCRGADMKLRTNATAILSIGPCLQKDALMQGAGRLRQLDSGQTIIAFATPNVESLIKDCLGLSKIHCLNMEHVVSYALVNSVKQTGISMKHWCSQGMRFLRILNSPSSILEEELSDLESLYAASDKQGTISQIVVPKLNSIEADYPKLSKTSTAVLDMLKERIELLGIDVAANYTASFEECERELEQEREMEKEREEALLEMHPYIEKDWDYNKVFTSDSPQNIDFIDDPPMSATKFFSSRFLSEHVKANCSCIQWDVSKIYLTYNFVRPLVEECPYDNYLRPVRMILFFPLNAELLVVSEREAENLWRCILVGTVKWQRDIPILCDIHSLKKSGFSPWGSLISYPGNVSALSHAAVSLLNGQTSFDPKEQEALENDLLQSKEAARAASFFCNHRGFSGMFHGSDLEKSCDNVMEYLHEQGTNH